IETALGEIESARPHTRQGLTVLRELGDRANEARALVNLAALERDAGNPERAIEHAREALELARTASDTKGEEAALGQLASLYLLQGRHEAALATVDSALRRARGAGLRPEEAANLEILAGLLRQLGHLPRALRLYDSAQAINRSLDEKRYETGLDLYHMAEIQAALGNLDVARTRAREARAIQRETGWTTAELANVLLLAEVAEFAGDPQAADEHLGTARDLASELGLRSSRLDAAMTEARIADRRGDGERVLAALGRVEDDLPAAGFAAESEAATLKARALAHRDDLAAAESAGRRAIELIGAVGGELASGLLRSTLAHSRAAAYAGLVDILLRQGRTAEAYEVAISASPGLRRHDDASAGHAADRREDLRRRIDRLAAEIRATEEATWDPGLVDEPMTRIRAARQEYDRLSATRAGATDPARDPAAAFEAIAVQSALRPGEALLQYLVGDEDAFVFLVTRDDVSVVRLDESPEALATRVRLARRLLDSGAAGDATEPLEALHAALLGPLASDEAFTGADRLIVVPHGVLTYLPFAALRDPATGRWLAEEKVLQHLPTPRVLTRAGRRRGAARTGFLADGGAVFAPLPVDLPASLTEARAVASALGRGVRLDVGERATEAAVRAALATDHVVHIASHAELNASNPLHSEIWLSAPEAEASDHAADGRLRVSELLELSIRSPLVFLSGCETGLGTGWSSSYAPGEDFATLERSLLESGAGGVVATLWRVEDDGAAEFASRFYEHLGGADPAEALARAQRDLIAGSRHANPYYWAAYRVAGDGRFE
ncbi:MAG: CHAT domain-containing tetratricopeptide repeat protein, partial [Gemmatimonadota bacterium]